jgi:hypothetical protein
MSNSDTNIIAGADHQHVVTKLIEWKGAFTNDSPILAPDQTIGHRDRTVVAQVVTAGPGNISRGTLNECTLRAGDLIVVNYFHKSHELLLQGENVVTFNWEHVMAKIVVDEVNKTTDLIPLQAYIICKTNEKRAQKIMMGKDSLLLAPSMDSQFTGGSAYNHKGKPVEQIKVAIEEVVSCGPGAVIDGCFQQPYHQAGDMVMYDTSVSPVTFRLAGEKYTMVNYRSVIMTFRDEPAVEETSLVQV